MSDDQAESPPHDEVAEEECEEEEDVQDDQDLIYDHYEYLGEFLPDFVYAVKTCTKEANVKTLNLASLNLEASHLRPFFKFLPETQITELNLENNGVRWRMLEFVQHLTKSKVTKLNLRNCEILKKEVMSLMQALKKTKITDLDLSGFYNVHLMGQSATTFVSLLIKSRVTHLHLDSTSLMEGPLGKHLARYLPHTSITYLDLSRSLRCNTKALAILFTSLPKTSVTELLLVGNEINDNDLEALGPNLRQSKLEVLSLHFNKITDVGMNMLTEALIHSKVRDLGVCMNEIKGANKLGRHLKETNIGILNIGINPIESSEMFSFPNFLEGTSVTQLGLNYSQLDDEKAQNLMKCLRSSKVTTLDVSSTKFGLPAVTEFAVVLKDTNITEVNFSNNSLSAEAFQKLGESLKGSKLQKCTVRGCAKYENGASVIAAFIDKTKGTTLDFLDIGSNDFKNGGAKTLAASLTGTTLTHLNLRSCKIGAGITDLAASLKDTAITHLDLSDNELGDEEAKELVTCLKETQIVDLSVERNSITGEGAAALVVSVKNSTSLHLNLESNKITDDDIEELAAMLEGTFVTDLRIKYNKGHGALPMLTVLWRNRFLVHKLVSFFKLIAPNSSDGPLCFDRSVDEDVTKFMERCLLFYKAVVEQPSAIGALAREESLSLSTEQVTKLALEEFPSQFAAFVGSKINVEVNHHVRLLQKAEECKLGKVVEFLLANRPVLMIDKNLEILHPKVYKLLVRYKQPICDTKSESEGKEKILKYFSEHPDVAGASDVVQILSS